MVETFNAKETVSKESNVIEKVKEEFAQSLNNFKGEIKEGVKQIKEGVKETKEVSWKTVQDRFDRISNRIVEVGQVDGQFAELEYMNKAGELVSVRTQMVDAPSLSISVMRKDGRHTIYQLHPTTYRDGKNTFDGGYTLWTTEMRDGGGDTMKNLSVEQVMQSLDKVENRLKEYETEQFDKMQQYAQNDSGDVDKVLDNLA